MNVINLNIAVGYTKYSQLETNCFGIIINMSELFSLHLDIFCLCFTSQQSQAPGNPPVDLQENPLKIKKQQMKSQADFYGKSKKASPERTSHTAFAKGNAR